MSKDVTEFLVEIGLQAAPIEPPQIGAGLAVTYHSACSMQHGQKLKTPPIQLLRDAGFKVKEPAEAHLCCGSAGIYNIMEPEISGQLKARKVKQLERTRPQVIATGNIGCITQLRTGTGVPVCHTVELLDWAPAGRSLRLWVELSQLRRPCGDRHRPRIIGC
jgi:glycolate oxidase iron-sulfur subunit